jgi:hypothetical protein
MVALLGTSSFSEAFRIQIGLAELLSGCPPSGNLESDPVPGEVRCGSIARFDAPPATSDLPPIAVITSQGTTSEKYQERKSRDRKFNATIGPQIDWLVS